VGARSDDDEIGTFRLGELGQPAGRGGGERLADPHRDSGRYGMSRLGEHRLRVVGNGQGRRDRFAEPPRHPRDTHAAEGERAGERLPEPQRQRERVLRSIRAVVGDDDAAEPGGRLRAGRAVVADGDAGVL
jgi:hypothetical protein